MSNSQTFTYQTRIELASEAQASVMDAYARLHGKVERTLFAKLQAGKNLNELKSGFIKSFKITARQFNSVRVGLDGKVSSIIELRKDLIAEKASRLKTAKKVLSKQEKKLSDAKKKLDKGGLKAEEEIKVKNTIERAKLSIHGKKRRIHAMTLGLESLEKDQSEGKVRLCFGSKKLFNKQFHLQDNGFKNHEDWKSDWTDQRNNQFFVVGSKDESCGNQTCQATVNADGTLSLRIRLPDALIEDGIKFITIHDVHFAYGHEQVLAALGSEQVLTKQGEDGKVVKVKTGTAISYRFLRDADGWRVFAAVSVQSKPHCTHRMLGAIGLDINADHIAVSQTDRHGNLIGTERVDLNLCGKTTNQAKALVGDVAMGIVQRAKAANKPLVIESLKFGQKKTELEAFSAKQAKMLSSFAYSLFISTIKAQAFRLAVEVIEVNPAYTSTIGAVKYATLKGLSTHQAAAYAIARRGLGYSERPLRRAMFIAPTRNGGHTTFYPPEKDGSKHGWSHWAAIRRELKGAVKLHVRSGEAKSPPQPISDSIRSLCLVRTSSVKLRSPNRQQHCLVDVLMDVPF
jgi:IS605 OrfB family transposase